MSNEEKIELSTEKIETKKIKKFISNGTLAVLLCVGLAAVLCGLRIYQMLCITDYGTGFFTDSKNITVLPMYIVFAAFVVVSMVSVRFSHFSLRPELPAERNIPLGVASALLFISIAHAAANGFYDILTNAADVGMMPIDYIKSNRAYSELLSPLFALFAAAVTVFDVVTAFSGHPITKKFRIMHLFSPLWLFTVTVKYFGITANYLKEPQFMILIFATVFFMLFMFEYARYVSGIGSENSEKLFFSSGLISVGLFFALLIPELLAKFVVDGYSGVVNADFVWWQAAAPVFAFAALCSRLGGTRQNSPSDEQAAAD